MAALAEESCPTAVLNELVDRVQDMVMNEEKKTDVQPALFVLPDLRLIQEIINGVAKEKLPEYLQLVSKDAPAMVVPLMDMGDTNAKRQLHMRNLGKTITKKMPGLMPFGVVMLNEAYMKKMPKDTNLNDLQHKSLAEDPEAQEAVVISSLTIDRRSACAIIEVNRGAEGEMVFGHIEKVPAKAHSEGAAPVAMDSSLLDAFFAGVMEAAQDSVVSRMIGDLKI